jgi:hypothetical protein
VVERVRELIPEGGSSSPRSSTWPCRTMWATIGARTLPVTRNAIACTPQTARAPDNPGRPARVRNSAYPRWWTKMTSNEPKIARAPAPTVAHPPSVQPRSTRALPPPGPGGWRAGRPRRCRRPAPPTAAARPAWCRWHAGARGAGGPGGARWLRRAGRRPAPTPLRTRAGRSPRCPTRRGTQHPVRGSRRAASGCRGHGDAQPVGENPGDQERGHGDDGERCEGLLPTEGRIGDGA